MTKQPGDSLASKIVYVGALIILLLIMGACVFVIYGYVNPQGPVLPSSTPRPSPAATYTPPPTSWPSPTPTPVASITPTPDSGFYQQDTKVTTGEFEYYYPGIWDHYIVYDMNDGMKNYSMLYDTSGQQTRQIDSGTVFSYGAISNGQVMLFYPQNGNKIYLYNIKTGDKFLSCTDDNNRRNSITMSDTKLAYYQDIGHYDTSGNWAPIYAIYVFNMLDGSTADVIDNIPRPIDIKMSGNKLVYTVVNGQESDIFLLDLSVQKPTTKKVSVGTGNNNVARIYGNTIVYHSNVDGKDHIYIYDINTGNRFIPAPDGEQWNADIYGNTVVYDDDRNGNWDIYAYDLNTHNERRLTNEPHDQRAPVVYGNRIVYTDNRNGYQALYTMTI
ncbi:MAG TPA: hypothetical protein VMC61_00420 [Methanocella sp.]|nr:hypothetical protein [Methanocella sp.]